ncbi:hypothetical protein [Empedobacter sp. GD03797]|nr:hypothetical protein [Empedobacter sp. GD03797]MDH1883912.1 hypothetical protein [Empedobacter sp. GD03797]
MKNKNYQYFVNPLNSNDFNFSKSSYKFKLEAYTSVQKVILGELFPMI